MFKSIVTLIIIGNLCGIFRTGISQYTENLGLNVDGFSRMLASIYTYALLLLVLLATALPLFTEEWLERRATDTAPSRGKRLGSGGKESLARAWLLPINFEMSL